jgi:hypothetical protein
MKVLALISAFAFQGLLEPSLGCETVDLPPWSSLGLQHDMLQLTPHSTASMVSAPVL